MSIYLVSNGKQCGPYTEEAVRTMHNMGQIHRDQLAWRNGLKDWLPLESVIILDSLPPLPPLTKKSSNHNNPKNESLKRGRETPTPPQMAWYKRLAFAVLMLFVIFGSKSLITNIRSNQIRSEILAESRTTSQSTSNTTLQPSAEKADENSHHDLKSLKATIIQMSKEDEIRQFAWANSIINESNKPDAYIWRNALQNARRKSNLADQVDAMLQLLKDELKDVEPK